ncbi:MAG: MBL fold metallo-hydrolase [Bacteroidota bacterium]
MKIIFLGTGTSSGVPIVGCDCEVCQSTDPKDNRLRSSVLVEVEGKNILIDIGPDFREQMLRSKVKRIDAVLLTHEHNDHIIGLDEIRVFNFIQRESIPVYATQRVIGELKKRFYYLFQEELYPSAPRITIQEVHKDQVIDFEGIQIQPIEYFHDLEHRWPVTGYRIKDFTYLTDFKTITPEELAKTKGTALLVISAVQHRPHRSHLNLSEALTWTAKIQAAQTYFIHMSHFIGLHRVAQNSLPDTVHFAYDGLVVNLNK